MEGLRIRLFGGLSLEREGQFVPPIPSRIGRSLFAYLVTQRHATPPSRDLLAGMFWPDNTETQARRRLSHSLWQIQSVLAELDGADKYLIASPTSVRFDAKAEHWLDVDDFDRVLNSFKGTLGEEIGAPAVRLSELDSALELYKGDFLAGFYEDWVKFEQERLRHSLLRGLEQAIRLAKSLGDLNGALRYAHRLTVNEPLREEAHREVMRLTFLLGRASEALAQYDRCRSILSEELGASPDRETEYLKAQIESGRSAPAIPFSAETRSRLFDSSRRNPLIGREDERSMVVSHLEAALAGRFGFVYVEGDAGMGKTRLLEECAEDAHWRGLSVLWTGVTPGAAVEPFHCFRTALTDGLTPLRVRQLAGRMDDALFAELAHLIPSIAEHASVPVAPRSLEGAAERFRLIEALFATIEALADLTPTLLVIDDVHLADPDSLAVLEFLVRHGRDMPLLICVAYRRDEAEASGLHWDAIRSMASMLSAQRVSIAPFDRGDTGDLLRAITPGTTSHELLDDLYDATGGNPLFVLETLRALHERQVAESLMPPVGIAPIDGSIPITSTISSLIQQRMDRQSAEARNVARLLAVIAEPAEPDLLEAAVGGSSSQLFDSLGELVSAGVARSVNGRYSLSHDQLRKVVYQQIDDTERQEIHRAVGGALERFGRESPVVLAHHFTLAEEATKSFEYNVIAARVARSARALETARAHLEIALSQSAGADVEPRAVSEAGLLLADIVDVLGDPVAQRSAVAVAEAGSDGIPDLQAEVALAWTRLFINEASFGEAAIHMEKALRFAEELGDEGLITEALAAHATISISTGRPEQVVPVLTDASTREIQPLHEGRIRRLLGDALGECQRYDEAKRELARAVEMLESVGDQRGTIEALGGLAIIEMESGRNEDAVSLYRQAIEMSNAIGFRYGVALNLLNLGNALRFGGMIGGALESYDAAHSAFVLLENERGLAFVNSNLASLRHRLLGDAGPAVDAATMALAFYETVEDPRGRAQCLDILAEIARSEGDWIECERQLDASEAALAATEDAWLLIQTWLTRARLMLDRGQVEAAIDLLMTCRSLCEETGADDLDGVISVVLAQIRFEAGSWTEVMKTPELENAVDAMYLTYWKWRAADASDSPGAYGYLEGAKRLTDAWVSTLSDFDQQLAMTSNPEVRAISEAWEAERPIIVRVRLSAIGVPRGRRVQDSEMVDVAWTVYHTTDTALTNSTERRRHQLLRLLCEAEAAGASPTIPDLAEAIGVSAATIRRDLAALRSHGHAVSTRGAR